MFIWERRKRACELRDLAVKWLQQASKSDVDISIIIEEIHFACRDDINSENLGTIHKLQFELLCLRTERDALRREAHRLFAQARNLVNESPVDKTGLWLVI